MDDDTTGRRGIGPASILGILGIVALLAVLAWVILREDDADSTAIASGETCGARVAVEVATTDDFAPVVQAAAGRVEDDDGCAHYEVTAASSAVTAERIAAGTDLPDVWIPDSDVWVERVNQSSDAPTLTAGPTLAISPVVLAVPSSLVDSTEFGGPHPWQEILGGPLQVRIGDPGESTAGLLLLHAANQALSGAPEGEQLLGAEMIRMSRQVAPEDELLSQAIVGEEGSTAVAATEQQIHRQQAESPDAPLAVVAPTDGTAVATYSWVPLPDSQGDPGVQLALVELEQALVGADGVTDRQEAGFRLPDDEEGPDVPGVPAGLAATVPPPTAVVADALVTTWNTVAVDMRMLAVIDVSGSMLQPAGDQTRIELAVASVQAAAQVFPPTSQVGLWMFSTDHPGGNDWTELAPIVQLDAETDGGTHRDAVLAAAATLPSHTVEGADTGLYDTALAAYREVHGSYEPGYVNSVVLLTDGVNEDDDGISLNELLAELQASVDPSRQVPIITVGMGTGVDEEALRLIAAQTGGRSYLAHDPADITTVFVDALTHRPGPG